MLGTFIQFNNVCDGDIFPYPFAFVSASVESTSRQIRVTNGTSSTNWSIVGGQFKCIIHLHEGTQRIDFFCADFPCNQQLLLVYEPVALREKRVRVLYIIPREDEGRFQSPDETQNSVSHAITKIEFGVQLLQTLTGERMKEQGFGRKTFHFVKSPRKLCHVFQSTWTKDEFWSRSGEEIWEGMAKELLTRGYIDEHHKVLAFLSCTTYQRPTVPSNQSTNFEQRYRDMLANTKAYVAYGAGGLALIGTPCLYTWSDHLEKLAFNLVNPELISPDYMDDSAFRGNWGGCFATTLGASLHELGHTLDLGHVSHGIMARGCDDLDRFFGFPTQTATSLNLCSRGRSMRALQVSIQVQPVKTRVIKPPTRKEPQENLLPNSATSFKQEGNAYWHRSNAVLLAYHSWLNGSVRSSVPSDKPVYSKGQIIAPSGLRLVELRTKENDYIQHWEFINDPPRNYNLSKSTMASLRRIHQCLLVFFIDNLGNITREWITHE